MDQSWISLLLLILCRFLLATRDLNYNVGRAKEEALEACSSVESVGSAMASMPHYLSTGVNTLTAESITKTVDEMMKMMMDSLDLVSNIVLFVINMFTQTYACLITFAVTGSLAASIELIEKVGKFMNESIGSATETLARDSEKFQDGLNNFLKKIQLPAFLGGTKAVPKIDISGPIESLRDIKIDPTAMNSELNRLNASLPNFADVQKFTEQAIDFPFMQLRKMMNDSKVSYSFDHNFFPVAEKKKLTFCSDNNIINNFFNDILAIISKAKSLFTALLITLAVLFAIATAYKEIRAWKKLHDRAIFMETHIEDHLELMDLFSRPHTSIVGYHFAVKIFHSIKRQNIVRWLIAYGTTVPALYVLSLGFAGLFSCLCQYILLKNVQKEVPTIAEEVGKFSDIVVRSLDDASKQWAVDANNVIGGINTKINKDVFGWVQTGTGAVNKTIDKFTDEMTRALNITFGGTILYKPIVEVMNCLVGLKVASFQRGLTWVHDQAHISIPEFKPNVFSLGAAASLATTNTSDSSDSFLASTGDIASDKVTMAIMKVIVRLQESIKEEAIISTVLISLWVILVLLGLSRVIVADLKHTKVRGEGGLPSYTPDNIPLSKFRCSYFKFFRQPTLSSPDSRNSTLFERAGSRKPFENEKTSQIS